MPGAACVHLAADARRSNHGSRAQTHGILQDALASLGLLRLIGDRASGGQRAAETSGDSIFTQCRASRSTAS
jgi:hypothetical protein